MATLCAPAARDRARRHDVELPSREVERVVPVRSSQVCTQNTKTSARTLALGAEFAGVLVPGEADELAEAQLRAGALRPALQVARRLDVRPQAACSRVQQRVFMAPRGLYDASGNGREVVRVRMPIHVTTWLLISEHYERLSPEWKCLLRCAGSTS